MLDDRAEATLPPCQVLLEFRDMVARCGPRAAFHALPLVQQFPFAEVSLTEVAAFLCWRREHAAASSSCLVAWDSLDCSVKEGWIPAEPITVLAEHVDWAPLLFVSGGLPVPATATTTASTSAPA